MTNKIDGEIGRIQKGATNFIIIRKAEFKGHKGVDVREYYETHDGMQFTKKGVWIGEDFLDDFKKIIKDI